MSSALDQIFVHGKRWLLSWIAGAPDWVIQITSSLINIVALLAVFLTLFALMSVLERKILARMQNRYGPNRVGPFGLFQPVADGIKMLIKEDIVPARADKVVHFLAPVVLAAVAILTLGVIPYGRNMTAFAINGGILFFFAVGSATELAVFMAGWASNNKFSMLGAMRAIAQMFSYELPLIIAVLPVVMAVGSLVPDTIITAQGEYTLGVVPRWFVFTPWGFAGFILFMIAATAETNRSPFDLPEGESELVAGYFTEYSGGKQAVFMMTDFAELLLVSVLIVTFFFGGWQVPWLARDGFHFPGGAHLGLPNLVVALFEFVAFWVKVVIFCLFQILIRWTLPRFRYDQLMRLGWKGLVPLGLANLVVTAFVVVLVGGK